MATIITDGKGNYFTPDANGQNWVPTEAPPAPTQQGKGELGYQAAPPETSKPAQPPNAQSVDEYGRVMPEGQMPSQPVVVGGNAPGYRQSDVFPIARREDAINDPNSRWYEGWALAPGPFKALGQTPAENVTINPETGTMNIAPEALATAATLGGVGGLRFGGRAPAWEPPGTLNNLFQQPLSGEFRSNPLGPTLAGRPLPEPGGPTTPTGIPAPVGAPPASASPNVGPTSTSAVPLSADEILTRSRQFYTPADQQAAQGAMIKPEASDGVRKVLTDAVPTDPQTAIAKGSTPLTQLGKDYADFQGQPMSFDTVMQLDRRLTAEKRTAMRNDPDLARQIGQAQDQIRGKMESFGTDDVTGDPQALANLSQARQAYAQYIKESQLDDIRYGATLLPAEKQDAFVQSRMRALLKSDQSRNWTPEERAAAEAAVTQGVRGFLANAGISIIKPLATAAGFKVAGPGGAWLGSTIGEAGQSTLRDALARRRPDRLGPVSGTITQGVPQNPLMPPGTPLQ